MDLWLKSNAYLVHKIWPNVTRLNSTMTIGMKNILGKCAVSKHGTHAYFFVLEFSNQFYLGLSTQSYPQAWVHEKHFRNSHFVPKIRCTSLLVGDKCWGCVFSGSWWSPIIVDSHSLRAVVLSTQISQGHELLHNTRKQIWLRFRRNPTPEPIVQGHL